MVQAARELFMEKGYEKTSVNDIIQRLNVAKGTFYHYFKTKDEIADAVIQAEIESSIPALKKIAAKNDIDAVEKMTAVIQLITEAVTVHYKDGLMAYLHHAHNSSLHLKMKLLLLRSYTPFVSEIVQQGVKEGVFHSEHPEQISEFLMAGLHFMLDPSFFPRSGETARATIEALPEIYEKLLGAAKHTFAHVRTSFQAMYE
nr:TetR/AcrR family transcriptional regulator [Paenibacillus turpanensis]